MQKLTSLFFFLITFSSLAQLQESFSDGDFTINPSWTGTASDFVVNATNQLQTNSTVASTSYLSTANILSDINDKEWRFYLKQSFAGSTTNYTKIFLTSDNVNLASSQNGYYLLFGEAGSNDAIKLFKLSAGTSTLILTGTLAAVANSFQVRVKITHSSTGEWKLYADYSGGNNYVLETSATDLNSVAEPNFGLLCQYTVSNIKKIFLDDIYAGNIQTDTIAPKISTVTVLNNQSVKVIFNEAVDAAIQSQVLSSIPTLSVNGITQNDPKTITVDFSTTFTNGTTYLVTIPEVKDLEGNDTSLTFSFTYLVSDIPASGDIIINEVFADPTPVVGLPEYDFVEIYNRSNKIFNVQKWKIANNSGSATINASKWLLPGEYLILTSTSGANFYTNPVLGITSFPNYKNTADDVILMDSSGNQLDKISYTLDWYKDNAKKDGGYSLERINPTLICSGKANWRASNHASGGTPNAINSVNDNTIDTQSPKIDTVVVISPTKLEIRLNEPLDATTISSINVQSTPNLSTPTFTLNPTNSSVLWIDLSANLTTNTPYSLTLNNLKDCQGNAGSSTFSFTYLVSDIPASGDIIINEVFADPTPVVGLPEYDFVEIYNRSNKIFNVQKWKIANNSGSATINASKWLLPGEYLVLTSTSGANFYTNPVLGITSFPNYKNTADDVILMDSLGNQLDKISYTLDWYKDNAKKDGGYSLERINPTLICSGKANWRASNHVSGGTPNAINSVNDNTIDTQSPKIDTVVVISPTKLEIRLNEPLDATTISSINVQSTPNLSTPTFTLNSTNPSVLWIDLSANLTTNTPYSLILNNLKDCQGNAGSSTFSFTYLVSDIPASGDIVINEVFADPTPVVGLPEYEYVEVFNRSSKTFNLKGWKIGNNSTVGKINSTIWIYPGEYKVLTSSAGVSSFPNSIYVTSFPSYKNGGDDVVLLDTSNIVVDKISYTLDWYKDDYKKDGGYSLERINPDLICSDISNWTASIDSTGGTPNAINSTYSNQPDVLSPTIQATIPTSDSTITVIFSEPISANATVLFSIQPNLAIFSIKQDSAVLSKFYLALSDKIQPSSIYTLLAENSEDCQGNITPIAQQHFVLAHQPKQGDIVINELLFNPLTGGSDFIELKNKTDKIFNLYGLKLTNYKTGTSNTKIILTDYLLYPHGIVVFTPDTLFQKQNYPFTGKQNFIQMSIPSMNNDASTIGLVLDSALTIDSLTYSEKWHFKLLDDKKGKSLERISADAISFNSSSWHTAAESMGFATPGLENSQSTDFLYNGKLTLSSETISPDNDGFEDYVLLTYETDNIGYVGSITIFDDRGREVRKLVKNELLGNRGEYTWDGLNDGMQRASVGSHVVLFEGYNAVTGSKFKIKKVIVVAGGKH